MDCIISAGPTYEPIDQVRRLTNFSTGRLGTMLAGFLRDRGHHVTLLLGEQASFRPVLRGMEVVSFATAGDLEDLLTKISKRRVDAVFHAAAVSDFACKAVYRRTQEGQLTPLKAGKIPSKAGPVLAELEPTPKIIGKLRDLFPEGWLVGWKYEVDGDRASSLQAGWQQVEECSTSACVVNGPAYGEGYGLAFPGDKSAHLNTADELFGELERLIRG